MSGPSPARGNVRTLHRAGGPVSGTIEVPGSKSVANRALAIAALAGGTSVLTGLPDGDDTVAMRKCLDGLGVATATTVDRALTVQGSEGLLHPTTDRVHAALAGTTSRFVTALAALADRPVTVDGDEPLRARPMALLHEALAALGAGIEYEETERHLPVRISGPLRSGGTVALPGDISSQFVSALMMIAPRLAGGLRIELTSPIVSMPYVRLTAGVMASFGLSGVSIDNRLIVVPEGRYTAAELTIEPDASSASYPLAVAAVAGGAVTVPGLTIRSSQGDVAFSTLLARMGCDVIHGPDSIGVHRDADVPLRGIDVDMADISDLVPTVAAVAVTAATPTVIRGVGFIRGKESDRLGDLAAELNRCGAAVTVTADGLAIEPSPLRAARLETHHDHRLAMAFAVLGAVVDGIEVVEPSVVRKSWPSFWSSYGELLASSR